MVNREALIQALEPYGNVLIAESGETYYLVVMENYISDRQTFEEIANPFIVPDYPNLDVFSLEDQTLKAQYNGR